MAGGELVLADEAVLHDEVLEAQYPFPVVAAAEIDVGGKLLAGKPADVDVPQAERTHGAVHRERAAFPRRVEHRLVRFRLNRAEALHAAHVVDAVHVPALASSAGVSASPVPIMELRVTSAASFSSLQLSVPAGRIGTTMKRVSAVESHTRISVSAGSVMPKSASTPRGSITARER